MTGLNIRRFLEGLLLCMIVPGMARFSHGDEPAAPPLMPIELTQVDDKAIAYATFQSHNQKVVSNRYGIFITYVRSAADNYMAQNRSSLFSTLFQPPVWPSRDCSLGSCSCVKRSSVPPSASSNSTVTMLV